MLSLPLFDRIPLKYCWLVLSLVMLSDGSVRSQETADAIPWELRPYRIQAFVAVDSSLDLPRDFEQDMATALSQRAASTVGSAWKFRAAPAPVELREAMLTMLSKMDADKVPASTTNDADKLLLVAVRSSASGYEVSARELDVTTRLWNATISADVRQTAGLRSEAFRVLVAAFAPLARIESVEKNSVALRSRAAGLARREAVSAGVFRAAAFRPVLVPSDSAGKVIAGKAEPIGWTYLLPMETPPATATGASVSPGLITCRVETGLRDAVIPVYHPQRQRWALGVASGRAGTNLNLVTTSSAAQPLADYEVWVEQPNILPPRYDLLGRSNRQGIVAVPPGPSPVRVLVVRQGAVALARLPVVPGLLPSITLPLADNREYLQIETELAAIEDSLIDLAASREVLLARIRTQTKNSQNVAANKLRTKLRELLGPKAILTRLDQQQTALRGIGADAANASSQRFLEEKLADLQKLAEALQAEPVTE